MAPPRNWATNCFSSQHQEGAERIGVEHLAPVFLGRLVNWREDQRALPGVIGRIAREYAVHYACIVDGAIEAAKGRDSRLDRRVRCRGVSNVAGNEHALSTRCTDIGIGCLAEVLQPVDADDIGAFPRQPHGCRGTHAAGRSGDDEGLAGKPSGDEGIGIWRPDFHQRIATNIGRGHRLVRCGSG